MPRLILIFFSICIFSISIFGQNRSAQEYPYTNIQNREGEIKIFQDGRIDLLIKRHIETNQKLIGVPGYRIRIFSQSGQNARQNANLVRGEFLKKHPDVEGYLTYDAPNFKVYVGDFRTRSEALKFHKKVSRDFPNAFIIADRINVRRD